MVIDGPWLLQMPDEIFIGALNVTPWSVERLNRISLQPEPWKSDHAAYTFPVTGSTSRSVLSLNDPSPNVFVASKTVRSYIAPSVEVSAGFSGAYVATQMLPMLFLVRPE